MEGVDPGIEFIAEQNRQLYRSREVTEVVAYLATNGAEIGRRRVDRIAAYIGFLADPEYVNDGILTGDTDSIDLQCNEAAIKQHPTLSPDELRNAQFNQEHSIRPWAQYLGRNEPGYPLWFRMYAFNAARRLWPYDQDTNSFRHRDEDTLAPYPQLHEGALDLTYRLLQRARFDGKAVSGGYDDPQEEKAFQTALRAGNFRALYTHALHRTEGLVTLELRATTQGQWNHYPKGSDPTTLFRDLQGFSINWCTSTGFSHAKSYIEQGDMYIYYTNDQEGVARVPRLAINVTDEGIAEVRGIGLEQEVEGELLELLGSKLLEFEGFEDYLKNLSDSTRLYALKKAMNKTRLNKKELASLFELESDFATFGRKRNPTITLLRKRFGPPNERRLKRLLPEALKAQFGPACEAYLDVCQALDTRPADTKTLQRLLKSQLRDWRKRGMFTFLANSMVNETCTYNLVVTPNVPVSPAQLVAAIQNYAPDDLCDEDAVDGAYFGQDAYTARQLSDTYGLEPARFSLVASEVFEGMRETKNLAEMRASLDTIRRAAPSALQIHSPSILETITYWYALKAAGTRIAKADSNRWRMAVTHFTMPPKFLPVGGEIATTVPHSTLDTDPDDTSMLSAQVYPENVEDPDETHFPRLAIS
jgi:hypothetical protein